MPALRLSRAVIARLPAKEKAYIVYDFGPNRFRGPRGARRHKVVDCGVSSRRRPAFAYQTRHARLDIEIIP